MTVKARENVLLETAKELMILFRDIKESFDLDEEDFDFLRDFFSSYQRSYSLSLAYPEELWKITAKNMGIDPEGKDRLHLAKEVFNYSTTVDQTLDDPAAQ